MWRGLVVMGIILAGLGVATAVTTQLKSSCTITMFNSEWNCSTFGTYLYVLQVLFTFEGLGMAMLFVFLFTPVAASVASYCIVRMTRYFILIFASDFLNDYCNLIICCLISLIYIVIVHTMEQNHYCHIGGPSEE